VNRFAVEYCTPLALWLAAIFFFSTDSFSAGRTALLILGLLKSVFPGLSPEQLDFFHIVIRKSAHIAEYFILAVLTYRALKQERRDPIQAKLQTLCLVVVTAGFDEVHQGLTFFRTASPVDVGYDCLGAVSALLLISLYETRRLRPHPVL
jgi:VanZ family protein